MKSNTALKQDYVAEPSTSPFKTLAIALSDMLPITSRRQWAW